MGILFSVSGIMSSEGKNLARYYKNDKTREEFDKYFNGTPPVFPLLPSCYKCCHPAAKAIFCCEFPCYRYKEEETEDDKKTENQKEGGSVEIDDVEKNASASVMHGSPTKDEMSSTLLENVESSE